MDWSRVFLTCVAESKNVHHRHLSINKRTGQNAMGPIDIARSVASASGVKEAEEKLCRASLSPDCNHHFTKHNRHARGK